MRPIRFLHAADFHLDSPFRSLPPEQAAERRRESRGLLGRMARYVRDKEIDLVLLAGDLFDSAGLYQETWEALESALAAMACPVFIAPGNHDCCAPGSPYDAGRWPENVYIFTSPAVERVALPELGVTVYGAGFAAPEQTSSLLEGFHVPEGETAMMVLHADMEGGASPYNPITRAQVADSGLAYLALGHIHQRTEPEKLGKTLWAYAGCPEGRGFDEQGEKGFYCGMAAGGRAQVTFVPFARRRYETLRVNVTGQAPLAAVEAALPPDTERDLYRLILTGETGEAGVDTASLERALSGRFYALELRDETTVRTDVWARMEEETLRGLFLRRMRARLDSAATPEERERINRAVRFGLAALDNRDIL